MNSDINTIIDRAFETSLFLLKKYFSKLKIQWYTIVCKKNGEEKSKMTRQNIRFYPIRDDFWSTFWQIQIIPKIFWKYPTISSTNFQISQDKIFRIFWNSFLADFDVFILDNKAPFDRKKKSYMAWEHHFFGDNIFFLNQIPPTLATKKKSYHKKKKLSRKFYQKTAEMWSIMMLSLYSP